MNEDDHLPTEPAADSAAPAESETSEAKAKVSTTEAKAETGTDTDAGADDGDEGDGGDNDTDGEGDKPKRPSRYQRLKRERDALAAEISQLRNRPVAAAADDKAALDELVRKDIGDPPKEDDFNGDWFAYERALTAYETEKRIATRDIRRQAQEAQAASRRHSETILQDFQDRQHEARKAISDFDQVVRAVDTELPPHAIQLILESEKGAVIQYHLAKNPEALERLTGMSPLAAAKEIARLEDRLSLPNPKTATKAAPPINAPKGGAAPTVDLSKMSMADYVAYRKKGAA
ncbi:MAG: hypothetical protein AAAC47_19160 [Pararhizobium sp.]